MVKLSILTESENNIICKFEILNHFQLLKLDMVN